MIMTNNRIRGHLYYLYYRRIKVINFLYLQLNDQSSLDLVEEFLHSRVRFYKNIIKLILILKKDIKLNS